MASLTKKVINGRPYYYLRETARVGGRSKVVRQVYLGRAEDIERRLAETAEPRSVVSRSFGAVAAALKLCRELEVAETIDRALGAGGRRDLRLIGLALCVALDSNIPLCHQTYEGNRNDSTQFPDAIELIKTRLTELGLTEDELSELTLVYDKGNNSKTNQPLADELPLGVVGSLSPSQHPELLDVDREQFSELEEMPGSLAYRTK